MAYYPPRLKNPGKLVSWTPQSADFVRAFLYMAFSACSLLCIGRGFQGAAAPCVANSFFFAAQVALPQDLARKTEFANAGKLSGKLANSSVDSRQIEVAWP